MGVTLYAATGSEETHSHSHSPSLSHMWNLSTFSLVLAGAYVLSFVDFLGRRR
jgi:hypothetical protein